MIKAIINTMPVVMIKSGFSRCGMLQPPPFKAQKSTLTLLAKVLVLVWYQIVVSQTNMNYLQFHHH